jgi:hypothetical protein
MSGRKSKSKSSSYTKKKRNKDGDFLYHQSCVDEINIKNEKQLENSLRKQGLMSHSTIGRYFEREPLPIEHRIWFQKGIDGSFADFSKDDRGCIVLRIDEDLIKQMGLDIKLDDQFIIDDQDVIVAYNQYEFVIPPWEIEIRRKGKWVRLPEIKNWKEPDRTIWQQLSPWILKDFKKLESLGLELDPQDWDDIKIFIEYQEQYSLRGIGWWEGKEWKEDKKELQKLVDELNIKQEEGYY